MNADEKQYLRNNLLTALSAVSPVSLPISTIVQRTHLAGFNVGRDEVERELAYLAGKGYVAQSPAELSRGINRYRLTAEGIDYLEANGLA